MKSKLVLIAMLLSVTTLETSFVLPVKEMPRTIITTDGEVDDQDSFIRMLLYADEFSIEGLVYSSSQWHYKGDGKGTKFQSQMAWTKDRYGERTELRWPGVTWMQEHIANYAKVLPMLEKHSKYFPSAAHLLSLVKTGNIDFEGEMAKDTEGSDWIKKILLDDQPGKVYLQIWGGTNTVARALKSIEDQYKSTSKWTEVYKKVSEKAVIYAVLDQDETYRNYVEPHWPAIKVLYNANQFWNFAYPWPKVVADKIQPYLRGPWFKENIKFNHGPLLSEYYLWGDGTRIQNDEEHTQGDTVDMKKNEMGKYDFISEGDSPAYFHLINVGLRNMEDASYGGWGGRMVQSANPNRWEDGDAATDYNPYTKKMDKAYPQTRWIDVLQNDFAARADWCVKDFKHANHAPSVTLKHASNLRAKPGDVMKFKGAAKDPDGNKLTYRWWQYFEADSYAGKISIKNSADPSTSFPVPADAKSGDTIHVILEVTDSGVPSLTRYSRVILTIE